MIDFLLGLLGDLFAFLPGVRRQRDRRKAWSGTVEAKRAWSFSGHPYLVIFRTDDGQRKKVRMDRKEDFDSYAEGRRYIKKAGEDLPETKPAA